MKKTVLAIGLFSILSMGCEEKKTGTAADTVTGETREKLLETYSQVPETSAILQAGDSGMAVYAICKQRYADQL